MALSFKTTPIKMSSDDCYQLICALEPMRVDPHNFIMDNGRSMYDEDRDDPLDGNRVYGNPIQVNADPDNGTVVLQAEGGLDVALIVSQYGYQSMSEVQGSLIDLLFDENFAHKYPGVSLIVESDDGDDNEVEIIDLDYRYSGKGRLEAAQKRLEILKSEIIKNSEQITNLSNQKNGLLTEQKDLEEYIQSNTGCSQLDNSLPF